MVRALLARRTTGAHSIIRCESRDYRRSKWVAEGRSGRIDTPSMIEVLHCHLHTSYLCTLGTTPSGCATSHRTSCRQPRP